MKQLIYLNSASTTKPDKKVLDEVVFPIICLYAGENNVKVFYLI